MEINLLTKKRNLLKGSHRQRCDCLDRLVKLNHSLMTSENISYLTAPHKWKQKFLLNIRFSVARNTRVWVSSKRIAACTASTLSKNIDFDIIRTSLSLLVEKIPMGNFLIFWRTTTLSKLKNFQASKKRFYFIPKQSRTIYREYIYSISQRFVQFWARLVRKVDY